VPVRYQLTGATASAIASGVEAAVRTGALAAGDPLPPVRLAAADLGISPATVAAAYRTLRQRGLIETAGRAGTRVRARPSVAGRGARLSPVPPGALDLVSGLPDPALLPPLGPILATLFPVPGAASGAVAVPARAAVPGPASAPDPASGPGARRDVLPALAAETLAADGVDLTGGAVAVCAGALDAIERVLGAHLRPGDRVAIEDPGWANLLDLVAALGLRAAPVPVDDDGPTPDGLRHALAAGARAVVVTTRAHNPTGASVTVRRATELRSVLVAHPDVLLIEDDFAAQLAVEPLHPLAGTVPSWAFVRSVSKPYGPDLRLAILAADAETIGRVEGRQRLGAGWVSTILQRTVAAMWASPEVDDIVARAREAYRSRREALVAALRARGLAATGRSGLNVWVPVPDETAAVSELREHGYAVAPGALYRQASPPGLRITVSLLPMAEVEPLADAIARVATGSGAVAARA